ncbi:MAG: EF-hand domain-containing protein [Hyphomicrobiaceae bacterium]
MSKKAVVLIAGALVSVGAVAALSAPGHRWGRGDGDGPGGRHGGFFHRSLTADENDARTRERFARIDKNGDGVIDTAEVEDMLKSRFERRAGRGGDRFADRIMKRFDADKDGKITKDEFLAAVKKRFARMDLDNDGKITDADLPPMMRGTGALTNGRAGRMLARFTGVDVNKDGVITLDEVLAGAEKQFARFDKNGDGVIDTADVDALRKEMVDYRVKRFIHAYGGDKDGKVTKEQFYQAAKDRFAMRDVNSDGTLSRDEMGGRRGWHRHGRGDGEHRRGPRGGTGGDGMGPGAGPGMHDGDDPGPGTGGPRND